MTIRAEPRPLVFARLVAGILIAVTVAVLISTYSSRDNLIAGCVRNGDSKIIDAQFIHEAAIARTAAGDIKVALRYRQLEIQKRATIPMPSGWVGRPETRGDFRPERVEGCKDAFPAPLSWVE